MNTNGCRRNFMKAAGAGALLTSGCATLPKGGTTLSAEELDRAAARPVLRIDGLNDPVIIESIELLQRGRDAFVRVRSRDGAVGISATNGRHAYVSQILEQRIIPYFIGKDVRQLEEHLFGLYRFRSNYKLQGLAFWSPQTWVECAILDMFGRMLNKPIGELIGQVIRHDIPFYVASGHRDNTPAEEVEYLQKLIAEAGAKAVKFRVGGRMSRNEDASPGRTPELIRLSRSVLGDGIDIHADSNSSYDPPQAIEVGRMLEEINAVYFEEPCPFDHLEDTKRVTDALTIPVAGGEQEFSDRRFRWMIQNRGVDIIQPDLHYYGGLIRSRRVARMAELAGMPTTVHISGGLGFVYMLHFASCTKDIGRYQEYKRGIERYKDWFDPPLHIGKGTLGVPTGPGVGIKDIGELLKDAKPLI